MKLLFRKIGIIFTALLLVAATGGYSVFRHICACEDRVIASVFLEATCEHDQEPAEKSCCAAPAHEPSCCISEMQEKGSSHCHSGDCCHTSVQFLKINDSFSSGQYKSVDKIIIAAVNLPDYYILADEHSATVLSTYYTDTSPPLSGRKILLRHHQLKLAPELG